MTSQKKKVWGKKVRVKIRACAEHASEKKYGKLKKKAGDNDVTEEKPRVKWRHRRKKRGKMTSLPVTSLPVMWLMSLPIRAEDVISVRSTSWIHLKYYFVRAHILLRWLMTFTKERIVCETADWLLDCRCWSSGLYYNCIFTRTGSQTINPLG